MCLRNVGVKGISGVKVPGRANTNTGPQLTEFSVNGDYSTENIYWKHMCWVLGKQLSG